MAKKVSNTPPWQAYVMYDMTTGQWMGFYTSKKDAADDCPGWRDEGYAIAPCEIVIVKKHK
jgi:hypothetical protein